MGVRVPGLVQVLGLRLVGVGVGVVVRVLVLDVRVAVGNFRLGGCAVLEDGNFLRGDAGAVYRFRSKGSAQLERFRCVLKDSKRDACVEEGSQEHVTGDAGETVKIGDTHGYQIRPTARDQTRVGRNEMEKSPSLLFIVADQAAIDKVGAAGDVSPLVRSEKSDDAGDVIGRAETAERNVAQQGIQLGFVV